LDHRDLTPLGAEGDLMVARLGDRLQEAGLYARAADLFEHQLFARARDLAQGPLSAKVARLHILAGQPERALEAIRRTTEVRYPANMLWEREQVAAVALSQLGRTEEALAVLDTVPGSAALKGEILWKKRDWNALAATIAPSLPPADGMSEVGQAKVLRYAVALAMMRRESELQALGARYGGAFAGLPSGPAFEALTGIATGVDGDALSRALASIPSASPAGDLADLLEISPAKATARGS
jgi:Flp pilus assembly protein TadD